MLRGESAMGECRCWWGIGGLVLVKSVAAVRCCRGLATRLAKSISTRARLRGPPVLLWEAALGACRSWLGSGRFVWAAARAATGQYYT